MASTLTLGRLEADNENVGGLRAVYFINWLSTIYDTCTITAEEIVGFTPAVTMFKYELKGNNGYVEDNPGDKNSGTRHWVGTGTLTFKKQSLAAQKEIKLLAYNNPIIVMEDYQGNFRLAGLQNGCSCNVTTDTGAAMGDFNGYGVTFTCEEKVPAYWVSSAIIDDTTNSSVTVGT